MKNKKSIKIILFSITLSLLLPAVSYASLEVENEIKKEEYSSGYQERLVVSKKTTQRDKGLGYHPDFSSWNKASAYFFFSSKSTSMTASINGILVSFKVDKSSTSDSGYAITADQSRWSRPYVYGDVTTIYYDLEIYNYGELVAVQKDFDKEIKVSNEYIIPKYR